MSTEEDQNPRQQRVADPEEFNQQRRLTSINEARDRCREVHPSTQDPTNRNEQSTAALFRATVEDYLMELEPLARRYDFDENGHRNLWDDTVLGTITVQPPAELRKLASSSGVTVIDASDLEAYTKTIVGMKGFLEADPPFAATFSIYVRQRHIGEQEQSRTVAKEMPVSLSKKAFRWANEFVAMFGGDIELEDDETDIIRGFDQSGDQPKAEHETGDYPGGTPDL